MKKRVLSIVCVIALIATMISAGAIYALGTDSEISDDQNATESTSLVGVGLEINDSKFAVAEDWTFSNAACTAANGITLHANSGNSKLTGTYNTTFNLTEGFTFTYNAYTAGTRNIANNPKNVYLGATVGNMTAGLYPVETKDAVIMVIMVDGEIVAQSDPIFNADHPAWTRDEAAANLEYFFSTYYLNGSTFTLKYDVETNSYTYTLMVGSAEEGTLTYVDDSNLVGLTDATVGFTTKAAWNAHAYYKNIKLEGKKAPVTPDPEPGEGEGEGEGEVDLPKGEALTEAWAPESFVVDEWTGDTSTIVDGKFMLDHTSETVHKTIWTAKKYDLSNGFKFTATLSMKNGYNNYYGEWCSAYFGDENSKLELRIKNDSPNNTAKISTYTAYIYDDGEVVASSSLDTLCNGEYELTYKNGKVSVALAGVKLVWTLADETTTNEVDVYTYLGNAMIGLKLTNNWAPKGREWKKLTLAPIVVEEEGGEGEEEIVKGETLTTWAPETFVEEDWVDSEGKFTANGSFVIESGNGTKTIWTAKNYDLSGGFKFKGTLSMKNGYNNYYGEWCSAYFGNERVNLELRIKNDSANNNEKDNTYTAYILYNGVELASSDLVVLPNGEYELTYQNGKVSVSLGGVAMKWVITADSSEATAIEVADADFVNAKLGLRLTGNYWPNGRKWAAISLSSFAGGNGGAVTGDARNIMVPVCVMLISIVTAITSASVLLRKKTRA